jgi:DNA polymerase-3 subunit delta'
MLRKDIPAQDEILDVFTRLVDQNRLPHSLLVHSNEGGVGLPIALFVTRYLLCDARNDGEACGQCPSCTKMDHFSHPDVHVVLPVNGTKSVRKEVACSDKFLEEWRAALTTDPFLSLRTWYQTIGIERNQGFIGENEGKELRKKLALRSYEGKAKVFLVWHADKMNVVFGNKMLKSLEEPNEQTYFILISEQPAQLLTTILSRVQRFQEAWIPEREIAKFIESRYEVSPQDAMNIAFRAEGDVGLALREAAGQTDPWLEPFIQWMRLAFARDMVGLFKWGEEMARNNRDAQKQFVESALKRLNRSFRSGWVDFEVPMAGEEAEFFRKFSPFINAANVKGFMHLLEEASFHIERNVSERIVWYDTGIKVIRLLHAGKKALQTT